MKPILYFIIIALFFSSCAMILNRKRQEVVFYTQHPAKVVYQHDTIPTVVNESGAFNKASVRIERKNKITNIQIVEDGIKKPIALYPHLSTAFWFNFYPTMGFGMLVDMWTPKIWAYPTKIYVGYYDSIYYRNRYEDRNGLKLLKSYLAHAPSHKKGEIDLHFSSPFINFYDFLPHGEARNIQPGIGGASIGLDYYHTDKQFLSLNVVTTDDAINSYFPVMDPDYSPHIIQKERSEYISLSNNHRINRLSIGYGITAARNNWNFRYSWGDSIPRPSRTYDNKTHYAFGFIAPVYFQFSKTFYTGFIYRPTIYRPNLPDKFKYEHLISVDFAWKFRIKK